VEAGSISVWDESPFELEEDLQKAVAAHPEALPWQDLGLGPLVALGTELDFGAGGIDLLAADAQGQLAIVEFKRGSENPDVRKVVAQLLDYGSSLWRRSYAELAERCARGAGEDGLAELAAERFALLDAPFDPDAFREGVERGLDEGSFAFVYVGRDLDPRTRRIMTFLAEGPRMRVFAVEVDHYRRSTDGPSVLVPRTAFVPSWVAGPDATPRPRPRAGPRPFDPATLPPETAELFERMDELAGELDLRVEPAPASRNYTPAVATVAAGTPPGVRVYWTIAWADFNLDVFRKLGRDDVADDLLQRISAVSGKTHLPLFPQVHAAALVADWERTRRDVMEPYFRAASDLAGGGDGAPAAPTRRE